MSHDDTMSCDQDNSVVQIIEIFAGDPNDSSSATSNMYSFLDERYTELSEEALAGGTIHSGQTRRLVDANVMQLM